MRVVFLVSFATLQATYEAGREYEVPDTADFVRAGLAVRVDQQRGAASNKRRGLLPQARTDG